jgi:hypothetical protein
MTPQILETPKNEGNVYIIYRMDIEEQSFEESASQPVKTRRRRKKSTNKGITKKSLSNVQKRLQTKYESYVKSIHNKKGCRVVSFDTFFENSGKKKKKNGKKSLAVAPVATDDMENGSSVVEGQENSSVPDESVGTEQQSAEQQQEEQPASQEPSQQEEAQPASGEQESGIIKSVTDTVENAASALGLSDKPAGETPSSGGKHRKRSKKNSKRNKKAAKRSRRR